jgi:hypothetical protein
MAKNRKSKKKEKPGRLIVVVGGPMCGTEGVMVEEDLDLASFTRRDGSKFVYRKHHVSANGIDCFLLHEVVAGPSECNN